MTDSTINPLGTDGFEFVEYAAPNAEGVEKLKKLFALLGFTPIGKHKRKDVTLFRQGDINFLVNAESDSYFREFSNAHGPCACAMAFRVKDAQKAYEHAVANGAKPFDKADLVDGELKVPAVYGIGDSVLYFVDQYGEKTIYDNDFEYFEGVDIHPAGVGLYELDHLTHNVKRGNMDVWSGFYERIGNFREIRYFDIEGKLTGLLSRAMTAPCGKIRIPINESSDDKSQIEEYLREYNGEGIQHIALTAEDIYDTVRKLREIGMDFMPTPDTYYEKIDTRVPGHEENIDNLRELRILVDGAPVEGDGILLQIFTQTVIGPIFFEIIQRKGNQGFGEGNFKALFESIEEDQIRRGVITAE
ncbi:4-hydroxyphenylpyruvate dioxygenase [Pleionea sp. CnH1-48]|uniref:4-hydroxyphenylpyruvate dioxygenase n=1 Tax=Pleionea sp. CnH1-48 TaxID=2954494 RepID=UPI002097A81E|nr:4-hydroxyphenylpyruvate dioxygenase [Pleionea sp. CnH1-48]MCO7227214.1 4-hydroxyphenylpyruvate dioxygenase [Pleionea sp. CnH1-48]